MQINARLSFRRTVWLCVCQSTSHSNLWGLVLQQLTNNDQALRETAALRQSSPGWDYGREQTPYLISKSVRRTTFHLLLYPDLSADSLILPPPLSVISAIKHMLKPTAKLPLHSINHLMGHTCYIASLTWQINVGIVMVKRQLSTKAKLSICPFT